MKISIPKETIHDETRVAATPQSVKELIKAGYEVNIETGAGTNSFISDDNFKNFVETLNSIAEIYKLPLIVSTHPRTKKRIDNENIKFNALITLLKPIGFLDYVKLQITAKATLSDSGTINEESSILNFPAINIRDAHERPEAMEEGSVMMTGLHKKRILQALKILNIQKRGDSRTLFEVFDYKVPNVSEKVVRIILSYTDYVNRKVWKKY